MDRRFPRLLEARYIPKGNSLHYKLLVRGRTYPRQENPIRNTMTKQKIICIGLPKTGTVSFCYALRKLGFSARHGLTYLTRKHVRTILKRKDAIAEIYGLADFEKIKEWYPDAKLIWTKRELDSWLNSCAKHFHKQRCKRRGLPFHIGLTRNYRFGQTFFEKELFKKIYLNFYEKIENYKASHPSEDILEIDITKGEGYEKLCPFLDVPLPLPEFPHKNNSRRNSIPSHLS